MTEQAPFRVRAAITSNRLVRRAIKGIEAIHGGIWLGLLDADRLSAATSALYSDESLYSEGGYNESGLLEWEREAVERHFPPVGRVLVASAGAGRELFGLEGLGLQAVGFDPSEHLVGIGQRLIKERGSDVQLVLSEPDAVPDTIIGPFDAVIVGWGGYVHIRGRAARIAFLEQLRSQTADGAPLLVSFFVRSGHDRQFDLSRSVAIAVRRLRRVDEPVELGDTVAGTFDHYSTWDEIEDELGAAGFVIVEKSDATFPYVIGRAE